MSEYQKAITEIKESVAGTEQDVAKILDLLKGSDLQEGNGLIHRVCLVEKRQRDMSRLIGIAGGIGGVVGVGFTYLMKLVKFIE